MRKENFLDMGAPRPEARQNNMDCSDINNKAVKSRFATHGAQIVDNTTMIVAGVKTKPTNISEMWSMG